MHNNLCIIKANNNPFNMDSLKFIIMLAIKQIRVVNENLSKFGLITQFTNKFPHVSDDYNGKLRDTHILFKNLQHDGMD